MKKARGNTRIILQKIDRIQYLIGQIQSDYLNDTGSQLHSRGDRIRAAVQEVHDLCIEITGMYDPLPPIPSKGE